jgi:hypothetical protein
LRRANTRITVLSSRSLISTSAERPTVSIRTAADLSLSSESDWSSGGEERRAPAAASR